MTVHPSIDLALAASDTGKVFGLPNADGIKGRHPTPTVAGSIGLREPILTRIQPPVHIPRTAADTASLNFNSSIEALERM